MAKRKEAKKIDKDEDELAKLFGDDEADDEYEDGYEYEYDYEDEPKNFDNEEPELNLNALDNYYIPTQTEHVISDREAWKIIQEKQNDAIRLNKRMREFDKVPTMDEIIKRRRKKGGTRKMRKNGKARKMKTKKSSKSRTRKSNSKRGGAKSKKNKKEAEMCPICFEELKKGEQIPKLNCKHKFHRSCLEPVCRQKGNQNVPCPLCRGDISFSCVADITRASPWKYNPYTSTTPYDMIQMRNMSVEERRQMIKETQKHHRNWLARRRRTIRNETPEQRTLRVETETRLNAEMETARDRYFTNPRVENEPFIPNSPDYPPPGYSPRSPASP